MNQFIRIGMDTSKHLFQLHGVNAAEAPVLKKKLRRKEMLAFFAGIEPTLVGIEACGASHHWARVLGEMGHEVKIMAPQLVKPYVKRGKNDAADAAALCEAMSRPSMRFVAVKSPEQQAGLMLLSIRDRLVRTRTQLTNSIRGHAAEFGLIAAKGLGKIEPLLVRIGEDASLPDLARALFADLGEEYARLQARLLQTDSALLALHRGDEKSRRLVRIPGVGPIGATTLTLKAPDPNSFKSGRDFAAWIGLTPRDHSTAGKARPGAITRAGDSGLRSLLVAGATAVIQQVRRGRTAPSPWLAALIARKPPKLAAVALANKNARIAWKMMMADTSYDATRLAARAA